SGEYTDLDSSGAKFRASITQSGTFLVVSVTGRAREIIIGKGVRMKFQKSPRASAIFDYGVAAKGPVVMNGNTTITGATDATKGSLLSATAGLNPLAMTGNPSISGDFSYTNKAGVNAYAGTIAGYPPSSANFPDHVHAGVPSPPFPFI